MKLFDQAHTLLFAYEMCVKLQLKNLKTFQMWIVCPSSCLTAGGFLGLKIDLSPPRFSLERRGYYHCQLPAYCTVVVSHFCESSPRPYPRKARGHLEVEYTRLLTWVTTHGKALLLWVVLLCISYFFLELCQYAGFAFWISVKMEQFKHYIEIPI